MDSKRTYCVGGRHKSNTIVIKEYEKINHKTPKLVKNKKRNGDGFGRKKPHKIFLSDCIENSLDILCLINE